MQYSPKIRFLTIVILPAVMPALILPILGIIHASNYVIAGTMGFFIGISFVGFVWIHKGKKSKTAEHSATDRHGSIER